MSAPRCQCGRAVGLTKTSDGLLCWWCDPAVPAELKQQAWTRGGRRTLATLPDPRFATTEGRRRFLEKVAGAVVRGDLSAARGAVVLKACEQAATEARQPAKDGKPAAAVVEMPRFTRSTPA